MQSSESPFRCHWWGTNLENAGLGKVRPDLGTYGRYAFNHLPPLPFEIRGDFAWLATASAHNQNIGEERAVENIQALTSLRETSNRLGLQLPQTFTSFMATPALHAHIRSNTDCFLDLCPEPVQIPLGERYLVRFLADSQGCIFWYLYLTSDGSDHAVVSSPDFYGTEAEQWQDELPDQDEIVFVAESFEAFMCRFWLENEIWYAAWQETPMPESAQEYMKSYQGKP